MESLVGHWPESHPAQDGLKLLPSHVSLGTTLGQRTTTL